MVSLEAHGEQGYWPRRFGVTEGELKDAVAAVETQAEDIRKYLRFPKVAR